METTADEQLAHELGFTPADLALNRAGQLSGAQAQAIVKIRAAYSSWPLTTRMIWMLGIATPFAGVLMTGVIFGPPLLAAVCLPAATLVYAYAWKRSSVPVPTWQLRSIEGRVSFHSEEAGLGYTTFIRMDDLDFSTTPLVLRQFSEGQKYRAYYVQGYSNHLLSVERLPDDPDPP